MDIATLIGFAAGTVLIFASIIMGGSLMLFINIPSILIVVGGTLAATFIKFPMGTVLGAMKVAAKAFLSKPPDPEALIEELTQVATMIRKDGVLALEKYEAKDAFLQQALNYLIANLDQDLIESSLSNDLLVLQERHETGQKLFKGMGDAAPAFGMIGTLIGLIQMMAAMSDPSSIGPAMAIALLTTFYGALIANLIAIPIADKLEYRSKSEVLARQLIIDGIVVITKGAVPTMIKECLQTYLPPKERAA